MMGTPVFLVCESFPGSAEHPWKASCACVEQGELPALGKGVWRWCLLMNHNVILTVWFVSAVCCVGFCFGRSKTVVRQQLAVWWCWLGWVELAGLQLEVWMKAIFFCYVLYFFFPFSILVEPNSQLSVPTKSFPPPLCLPNLLCWLWHSFSHMVNWFSSLEW